MSRRWQTCLLCGAAVALLAVLTNAILANRALTQSSLPANSATPSRPPKKLRNLVLQPEAAAVNRRLGNRFRSDNARSVLTGHLTVGTDHQPVTIIRSQTDDGERVELVFAGRQFTWSGAAGINGAQELPTAQDRLRIERLVFDSPDQFVLAQLRGASYQTVFRNLRPTDAGDDYAGPLWTMVRINDPQSAEGAALTSPWRLYYINSNSGLIDRIESELDGQRVAASILQWTEQNGEKIPSHIRWTINDQMLMEFELTSFSQGQ